jgi:[ribosomal protein S18]-alanine N-acetyltransferase
MQFRFKVMDAVHAHSVAAWQYEGIYTFYDASQDAEDLAELLDPASWKDRYYAVLDQGRDLVGYFSFQQEGTSLVIGLGLRPDLTGRGLGLPFLEAGLAFGRKKFHPVHFSLSVATFNQRAIRLYEKAGFQPAGTFLNETNGGTYEFLRMVRES